MRYFGWIYANTNELRLGSIVWRKMATFIIYGRRRKSGVDIREKIIILLRDSSECANYYTESKTEDDSPMAKCER